MENIYLDHAASTPIFPESLESMLPYFHSDYGNASSLHYAGRKAKHALDDAREQAAALLGCSPQQLLFTSGGTESDNVAILGTALHANNKKRHIISCKTEHKAVLETLQHLEDEGFSVTYLPVDHDGRISLESLKASITEDTFLITLMAGNNETGTLHPFEQVGQFAKERGILFHIDAVQALGVIPFHLKSIPADLVSFSSHKINGPKGVGLLYAADNSKLTPLLYGGNQEAKKRPGTENIPAIAGFVQSLEMTINRLDEKNKMCTDMRNTMLEIFYQQCGENNVVLNGHPTFVLPHILNVSFLSCDTETLLMNLDLAGIAASGGSACTSGSLEVSHVLQAMNLPTNVMHSAVRFSFGYGLNIEQISKAAKKTATIVQRIRK
ncbi:cysteine desulfurase family protein [Longirhabdus pacifica]|uniref:cysteine desulfurase family protein n=1 Tax=Longirhabdus pacifica TaxID=2305227 RepID=UPI0010088845|nr:cysteine desulfurase family protein [Longirhabdus pacifica]